MFINSRETIMHQACYKRLFSGETHFRLESELATISWLPFGIEIENQGLRVGKVLRGVGLKDKVKESKAKRYEVYGSPKL